MRYGVRSKGGNNMAEILMSEEQLEKLTAQLAESTKINKELRDLAIAQAALVVAENTVGSEDLAARLRHFIENKGRELLLSQ